MRQVCQPDTTSSRGSLALAAKGDGSAQQGGLFVAGPVPSSDRTVDQAVRRHAELVSYGAALGSKADDPMAAILFRSGELLPHGMIGQSGEIRVTGVGRRTSPLTEAEATAAVEWMDRLSSAPVGRIDVALRRLVRGLAERLDRADALIDGVIAWEKLVEHQQTPTRSVIWGIHQLVRTTAWSKTRITRIYTERSNVIHGEQPTMRRISELAPESLQVGLSALRALLVDHPDKLAMTSEQRVEALGFVPRDS